jgi:isocitrate dehydrogenase (NAD+)
VVRATDGLFLEAGREVARAYPEIEVDEANIDAITMWLLKNPFNYDVLVAPNLYGDIISDLCAQMVGGLGFGCSGNIGEKLAVFEPTHGSAPKYAGKDMANPTAEILSATLMLRHMGEIDAADRILNAIREVIGRGEKVTYDIRRSVTGSAAGAVGTQAYADALIDRL